MLGSGQGAAGWGRGRLDEGVKAQQRHRQARVFIRHQVQLLAPVQHDAVEQLRLVGRQLRGKLPCGRRIGIVGRQRAGHRLLDGHLLQQDGHLLEC